MRPSREMNFSQEYWFTGMTEDVFAPDAEMTRAQFAAITVRALGLEPNASGVFDDVDLALAWHPASVTQVDTGSSQSCISAFFRFHGKALGTEDHETA